MSLYDEVDIADFAFDAAARAFTFPCPCGDRFSIALDELLGGEDVAGCPSCSLRIRVLFDEASLERAVAAGEAAAEAAAAAAAAAAH